VLNLVGDLEHRQQAFDRLNETFEDIEAVVSQMETNVADLSQSTAVTDSQRLHRLHVSYS